MNAVRKSHRSEHSGSDEAADAARLPEESEKTEETGEGRSDRGAAEAPPHALWDQLDEWVSGGAPNERSARKLPVAARLAIILLLSIACWLVLIALISLV